MGLPRHDRQDGARVQRCYAALRISITGRAAAWIPACRVQRCYAALRISMRCRQGQHRQGWRVARGAALLCSAEDFNALPLTRWDTAIKRCSAAMQR